MGSFLYVPSGVYRTLDFVQERLPPQARQVLELGAGNGFNLQCLARRAEVARTSIGIDLVLEAPCQHGNRTLSSLSNARMQLGDFENLGFSSGRFDTVYAIESLCHARNLSATLGGIARVLNPRGLLIVVDAWRTGAFLTAERDIQSAVELTERAMSVSSTVTQGEWIDSAQRSGLELLERLPLKQQVMPNLERFEDAASFALQYAPLVRLASRALSPHLLANIVAGYLMAETVREGLHTYDLLVLGAAS